MVARRLANMDLPVPGGPMSRTLWPPAAAISNARFTDSWPLTSAKSFSSFWSCAKRDGQHSFHRPHCPIQSQLTHHHEILELICLKLLAGGQHPDGNREIEARSFLFDICRREIDRRAAESERKSRINQRSHYAV